MKPFLQICIGISLVIFASAFFVRSATTAHAEPTPLTVIEEGAGTHGKYQVSLQVAPDLSSFYAIILNTESGTSAMYVRNANSSWEWKLAPNQVPAVTH